jgi:carboxypeptidase family protein/TonB-dependent receptor-like protein
MRGRWKAWFSAALLLGVAGLGPAGAQTQRGAIRGEVVDSEGAALPGVQVTVTSPALIQPRSVVTGPNGDFNVPALPIGTYTIEASLASFAPAKQENVRVLLGGTANVRIQMRLETAMKDIVVEATATEVLDRNDTKTGDRVTYEELIKVPTARDPWAVLSLVPGIQTDRVNVGGTESGQQANFVAKGDNGDNTTWTIDGVTITDVGAIGSSPTYYDFGALEEVQVSTGGYDVSQLTGGIGINIVTKRGSNDLHGSGRVFFTNKSLQSENIDDSLAALNFHSPKVDQILEFGGEAGGPILKDRLWFWGSANRNKIEQITITGTSDNTTLTNFAGKLSGQVSTNNEANAFFHFDNKQKEGRTQLAIRDQASSWHQDGPSPIVKVEDQQIFGSDGLVAVKLAYVDGKFTLHPLGSLLEGGPGLQGLQDADTGAFSRNFNSFETDRPQYMGHVDGSWFKTIGSMDNDFKFGFSYRDTPVQSGTFWDDGGYVLTNWRTGQNPDAPSDTVFAAGANYQANFKAKTLSAYASDTITKGSLTVDVGVRFDRQTTKNGESHRDANKLVPLLMPQLVVPENSGNIAAYSLLSPRVGLTYQIGDKTLAKASYALYADQITTAIAAGLNPITYQYVYSYFDDRNHDLTFQPDEILSGQSHCGGLCFAGLNIDPDNPNSAASLDQVDPNLGTPKTHEVILGLTRQVGKDSSVGVNFTYRRRFNDLWAVPLVEDATGAVRPATFDDWAALTPTHGNGAPNGDYAGNFVLDPYTVQGWTLKDGVSLTGGTLTENRPDYYTQFLGAELVLEKRFSQRWSFAGNFALNSWTEHFTPGGAGDFPNPNRTPAISASGNQGGPHEDGGSVAPASAASGPKANVFINANWQSNIRGTYTIPKVDVDLGANLLLRQGYPSPFTHRVVTDIAGNSVPTTDLLVGQIDDQRMATVASLDLRLGKEFNFAENIGLELSADVFNVFNTNVELQHIRRANASNFLTPTELIGPRLLRLSARLKF